MQEFGGNHDRDTVIYRDLNPLIKARYIRFRPIDWHGHISMRVELYGCLEGTPGGEFLFLFSFSLKKKCEKCAIELISMWLSLSQITKFSLH